VRCATTAQTTASRRRYVVGCGSARRMRLGKRPAEGDKRTKPADWGKGEETANREGSGGGRQRQIGRSNANDFLEPRLGRPGSFLVQLARSTWGDRPGEGDP